MTESFVAGASVGIAWATDSRANEGTREMKRHDAVYLELAIRRRLDKAAKKCGVKVLL
ncbi:MAG: hypothetical protein ABI811_20695 [Acidobacteriota bacterium]